MEREEKIKSGLAADQDTFTYEIKGVTTADLQIYCAYAQLNLNEFKIGNDEYYVPGHYYLGLFRAILPEIAIKNTSFPFNGVASWSMSTSSTFENRILLNQDLILKMQLRTTERMSTEEKTKYWFWAEFVRKFNDDVVLSGIFGFIPK